MATTMNIWCLLIDHEKKLIGTPFEVTVSSVDTVDRLRKKVKEELSPKLDSIAVNELAVWRCMDPTTTLDDEDHETLEGQVSEAFFNEKVRRLGVRRTIADLKFSKDETLLVQMPKPPSQQPPAHTRAETEEARDIPTELPAIEHRKEYLKAFEKVGNVSVNNPADIAKMHELIFNGRALTEEGQYGLPVSLYHPDLATLQHQLDTLGLQIKNARMVKGDEGDLPDGFIRLDSKLFNASERYFTKSRAFYPKESERWSSAVKPFCECIFGTEDLEEQMPSDDSEDPETRKGSSSKRNKSGNDSKGKASRGTKVADAVWKRYLVLELKNEYGVGGDPILQGTYWFAKSLFSLKEKFKNTKFPFIIIGITGTVIEVSIAVCLEKVLVDKILHFEIRDGDDDDESITKLALIASALQDCVCKLRKEWHHLEQTPPGDGAPGDETWHLPRPSVVPSPNSSMPALKFKRKLSRENKEIVLEGDKPKMCPLFLADYTTEGSSSAVEAVVKFAVTYNKDVHKELAVKHYAPWLYACESVIGGREMVVMERVHGKHMCDYPLNSIPSSVFKDIDDTLKILHSKKLVFGDLRDMNVMILDDDSDGRTKAQFIDFDWVGENGQAYYPALINTKLIGTEYDSDVRPCGLMRQEHDG